MANKEIVKRILESMWTLYPQSRLIDENERVRSIGLWMEICADVDDACLTSAAAEYLRSAAEWMPTPGMLRTRALELEQADTRDAALGAWEKIIDSDFGRASVDDPLALRTMRLLGGFSAFAASPVEDEHFWRDQFVRLYAELYDREQARRAQGLGMPCLPHATTRRLEPTARPQAASAGSPLSSCRRTPSETAPE